MQEQWPAIPSHVGFYEVSDLGRVRSLDRDYRISLPNGTIYTRKRRGRILKSPTNTTGYPCVCLWADHVARQARVHCLVLEAFVSERPEGLYGCHHDGKRNHNSLSNLYWGTPTENSNDKLAHGTHLDGERIPFSKLTAYDVVEIRRLSGLVLQRELAERYGVRQSAISRVQSGTRWKDRSGALARLLLVAGLAQASGVA